MLTDTNILSVNKMSRKTPDTETRQIVSVVITTYNSSREVLERAVNSVANQTYDLIELIVVDDCSSTPFAGLNSAGLKERINWVAMPENKGVAAARNKGVSVSQGAYVAFLDHDDWWESDKIQSQVDILESCRLEWCYCGALYHDCSGDSVHFTPEYEGYVYQDLLKNQIITGSVSSVLMTHKAFRSVNGFDESRGVIEDWDLWIRLSKTYEVGYIPAALVHLGSSPQGSRSSDINGRLERLRGTMRKHEGALLANNLKKYSDARYYRVRARLAYSSGQKGLAWCSWCLYFTKQPTWLALRWILLLPFLRKK